MPLAPPIQEVEQSVERLLAQESLDEKTLLERFGRARGFLLESEGLFREVEDTLVVDDEGRQKLELCAREMQHSLEALNRLQEAAVSGKMLILRERLQTFLISRTRCLEYFAEFSRLAAQQPIYSPVPAFDAFIKSGIKVLEGQLDGQRLRDRFSALMPELHKVQRLVGLLPRLHEPPQELMLALNQGLQGLQTGYGALAQYLEKGDRVALEDGLKLLGSSSNILNDQLARAEQFAQGAARYSKFRPVEEWLRLKDYVLKNPEDKIPPAWIGFTVAQVFLMWDFLLDQAQGLLDNPLLRELELTDGVTVELLEESLAARAVADQELAPLTGQALMQSSETLWLEKTKAAESLQAAVAQSLQHLDEAMAPYRELPGLENIVLLKDQVKKGLVDKASLRNEFHNQLQRVEELLESVRQGQDPISVEFRDILPIHRSAFMGMLENLESDDWFGLENRWQGVVSTLPHLADLSRNIRQRLKAQGSASKRIQCVRCGNSNEPTRRVCSSCGANLPTVIQKMQTFSEIDTGQGGPTVGLAPRAIDLLESMVQGLESNQTTKKDAAEALQLLIDDVSRQRQMFTKKLLPLMGKDETLDSYLRYFAQGLGQYFTNLNELQQAVREGSLPRLHSGLTLVRDTLDTLDAMKDRIDEALAG